MLTAPIFNIQKFSLHDGPGVRTTVFLKGCPLSCTWCHNPESQNKNNEILSDQQKCTSCGGCLPHCPAGALYYADETVRMNRGLCTACGVCAEYCPNGARELAGRAYTVPELLAEIEKDRPFFELSAGGVTFSGGEPLLHIDFLEKIAAACKGRGISVCIDTCGAAPFEHFERLLPYTDLFLYDIKFMDEALHKQYTGAGNAQILENLRRLMERDAPVNLRLPLIEGVNTGEKEMNALLSFVHGMPFTQVNLLPYHDIGRGKYTKLGLSYGGGFFRPPSEETLSRIQKAFEKQGHRVSVGG